MTLEAPTEAKVVKAKPLSNVKKSERNETLRFLAMFCYYYPAYTLDEARKLSYRKVTMMVDVARKVEAGNHLTMLSISTAPHTKKGVGVKKLERSFRKVLDG